MASRPDPRSRQALTYRRLYGTARWRALRRAQLQTHPLCARCEKAGFTTIATVCNHVDPKKKLDPATFFDGPFESACQPCHDQAIKADELKGVTTSRIGYSSAVDAQGLPTDSRHPFNR